MPKSINFIFSFFVFIFLISCGTHKRSFVQGNEEFIIEVVKPTRGSGMIDIALQGLFLGADYLAEKTSKSLSTSYSQSLSINDYYMNNGEEISKSYQEIVIKKYAAIAESNKEKELVSEIKKEINALPKSRSNTKHFSMDNVIRNSSSSTQKKEELLNFEAKIAIETDPENPGISRLNFNELRVLFSRTKVYEDENLNAKLSISIEGQWRNKDNTPMKATLIEQEYDLRELKYGVENQIKKPIISPWYYDIPYNAENEDFYNYGVVQINVQLVEYEGGKSKYINQLPSILSDNKDAVIKQGDATIQKLLGK